ncbi:hypothetical protein EC988_001824 [Linderina pennispora]|nr:hypothetical protein EC988_001824 [Linderina pennispora]
MKTRPLVVLDDYFVKRNLFSQLKHSTHDIRFLGGYFEVSSGSPFLTKFFSTEHIIAQQWMRTADTQITYSWWLYAVHLAALLLLVFAYLASLSSAPLVYSLGTLPSICLLLVVSYHVCFFLALNYKPTWFERTVIFHSPFAWAAAWLLVLCNDSALAVPPTSLLAIHVFIWYVRRTAIGIVVFERKIRASSVLHWSHRAYSLVAPILIAWAWKWYPCLSVSWDLSGYSPTRDLLDQRVVRQWAAEREIPTVQLLAAMAMAGGLHVVWYSFISYAYHMVVWKDYLREGLAVWVVSDGAMCTKLF